MLNSSKRGAMINASFRAAAATALLLVSQCTLALGLGEPVLSSDLSSPLRLIVPLTGLAATGIDIDEVRVDVPNHHGQVSLGILDPVLPENIKVALVVDGRGAAIVRITTSTAVREPALRFALRASWKSGSILRKYEFIIDPPAVAYSPVRFVAAALSVVRQSTALAPAARSSIASAASVARAGTNYGPVVSGDTLYEIAASAYPQLRSRMSSVMSVMVVGNRDAFVDGDANRLRRGAWLVLPTANSMGDALDARTVSSLERTAGRAAAADRAASYTVVAGDTLYGIARRVLGVAEAQIPDVVKRLHVRNPHAFVDGRVNLLQIGAVLNLGSASRSTASALGKSRTSTMAAPATIVPAAARASAPIPNGPTNVQTKAPVLASQLANSETDLAAQRQTRSELRERLNVLANTLQALHEGEAQLKTQTDALIEQLEGQRAALPQPTQVAQPALQESAVDSSVTPSVSVPNVESATVIPAVSVPNVESATVVPVATPYITEVRQRAVQPATQSTPTSLLEYVRAVPVLWIGGGVLMLLLAVAIALRRRAVALAMAPHVSPADDATMHKLAKVREHFSESGRFTAPLQAPNKDETAVEDTLRMTDAAHAARVAREAAVHLAYGDLLAARGCIEKAIKLDPHRDEHKMVLVTVFENMGEHAQARKLVDDMLTRREQLSGELLAQVEQLGQRERASVP
jgi:Tfp pilus assembly protein FimV